MAQTDELAAELASPSYVNAVGGYLYTSGMSSLSQGKSWTRSELLRPVVDCAGQQTTIDVLDPVALKPLLEDPDAVIQGDRVLHLRYRVRR